MDPIDVVKAVLANPTSMDNVAPLVADDFTYVSLNYENPELKKLMPWCGTGHGVQSLVKTFQDVGSFWHVDEFDLGEVFASGENVAIFGKFTYTSTVLGKQVTTPMAIFSKVRDGKLIYMQFMEDTFATGMTFRNGGQWTFTSNPAGGQVAVPDEA